MENINTELKKEAINLGLCSKWKEEWSEDSNLFTLIDKFKKGQDFCIQHNYPSLEYIRQNFNREQLMEFGIFVDHLPPQSFSPLPNGTYVCMGNCSGELVFPRWGCALVYLRHESQLRIIAGDFAKIFVRLYDNSDVKIYCEENASIKIFDRR